MIGSI